MNELIVKDDIKIENMIYEIREREVMLDSDLAMLFGYETGQLNRQVQRNIDRFPEKYCFKLTNEEYNILRCQIGISTTNAFHGEDICLEYLQNMELQCLLVY